MSSGSSTSFESGPAAPIEFRRLILAAMIRVVGDKGYREATVADVVAAAGTSEAVFDEYFGGKHECFLAAYETLVAGLFDEVAANCDPNAPWVARMRAGLATIVELFVSDPALARAAVVEPAIAGTDALRLYFDAIGRFGERLHAGCDFGGRAELPEHVSLMAAGGVAGLISEELMAGRGQQLPDLFPGLLFALLLPYIGPDAAAAEMRQASEPHWST
jgi:AcrR family transcriptional regulator